MRHFILVFILIGALSDAQTLPFNFETTPTTEDFINFDGGIATVISNPQQTGINSSSMVAQIVRDGGEIFAGSKLILANNLDFSINGALSMKVFTTAPIGTTVKFKLEGSGSTEIDVLTTVSGEWETLVWDFTGTPSNFNELVFMFDFGNVGDGSASSTFLFDDIEQFDITGGLDQMDLPVDFESPSVYYALTSFEGNTSAIVQDPTDSSNTVGEVTKPSTAGSSAGTTIGTNAGFINDVPLTLTDSKMYVRTWSPDANIPVRLKVEDSDDPTHTVETETNTTVAGQWEVLEFDFINEAPGTASLSFGLDNGWTYNMASIFFNFGTNGATAGNKVYYFDNVAFGSPLSVVENELGSLKIFPNPTNNVWYVKSNSPISSVQIYDILAKQVMSKSVNALATKIDATKLNTGIYFARITAAEQTKVVRLIKE